ncbi:amino acid adenylation domain-containing protein [Fulvivirga ulvae]|uniref:non-ribosomal peptide synthetase n=1 Tax=Fulvivirga ulvae TaxID=2904245 RepID=UPI001F3BE7B5|nr:non-ribosomal peptide synthetase [Fulvivirga ulvae]UII31895.1 amino acid adenylation domain-containing protein [Fulvivirga ulvae]
MNKNTPVASLVNEAEDNGFKFFFDQGKLRLRVPKEVNVDRQLVDRIKSSLDEVTAYLREREKEDNALFQVDREPGLPVPLSFAQKSLWFIDQLQGSRHYYMHWLFDINGTLDQGALDKSFEQIIARHEVLRTAIVEDGETCRQELRPISEWALEHYNEDEIVAKGQDLDAFIEDQLSKPINLYDDWLIRAVLIERAPTSFRLMVIVHHMVFDGLSASILVQELQSFYQHYTSADPGIMPVPEAQYADFAIWQNRSVEEEAFEGQLQFWKENLTGLAPLEFPTDFARSSMQNVNGAVEKHTLSHDTFNAVVSYCRNQQVTASTMMLAVFKALIYRYTDNGDVCVGSPIDIRNRKGLDKLIGFFVNTLPIRTQLDGSDNFSALLMKVRQTMTNALENRDLPLEKIVEAFGGQRDVSRNPLFQIIFVMQSKLANGEMDLGGMALQQVESTHHTARFDLEFNVFENDEEIELRLIYNKDLYKQETAASIVESFLTLLKEVLSDDSKTLDQLTIIDDATTAHLVEQGYSRSGYPEGCTIIDLFYRQVQAYPQHIAISDQGRELTYSDLDEKSSQLGRYLLENGLKSEQLVPVCMESSAEFIISILAILKAGGGYVPINPTYPSDRIDYILEDTKATLVLAASGTKDLFKPDRCQVIEVDSFNGQQYTNEPLANISGPDTLAYVIYTSGSTGKPKGVLIEHVNVVRLIQVDKPLFDFNEKDSWTLFHSTAFDFSVWEIFGALLTGGKLVIVNKEQTLDPVLFLKLLREEQVTILNQTPSAFYSLQENELQHPGGLKVRYVIFGGEALDPQRLKGWSKQYPDCSLVNMYGITETTVHVTFKKLTQEDTLSHSSNIGRAIPTTSIYILNKNMNFVPDGVVGEIYVGGYGVGRGYLNREALTLERFVDNPFGDGRLYKSGDLGRRLHSGDIEYIGRADNQVKIRGYRIEIGEIEGVLNDAPGVSQAVVLLKEDDPDTRALHGFAVVTDGYSKDGTLSYLGRKLPGYMLPAAVHVVEEMPLTTNGKIDKAVLLNSIKETEDTKTVTSPRNETEAGILNIWERLLNKENIGVYDNFFELGGHSLLVTRMASSLRNELQVEISVKDIFLSPTIASIAQLIKGSEKKTVLSDIQAVERQDKMPLSYAQERLWFIHKLHGSVQYHMPAVFQLGEGLDTEILEYAFKSILKRHEVLRTKITEVEGVGYQQVMDETAWSLAINIQPADQPVEESVRSLIDEPFDLSGDYMLRATLIRQETSKYILVVVMHHIASDGWSLSVMLDELMRIYNSMAKGLPLESEDLEVQYADYAWWQRELLSKEIEGQLNYWKDQLADVEPVMLLTDYPRGETKSHKGAIVKHTFSEATIQGLRTICKEEQVTLFMVLIAAFKVLINKYTTVNDICVGIPLAGRRHSKLEHMIGFFVNTLALRSQVDASQSFKSFLKQIENVTLEAYANQDTPFEKVVEEVVGSRNSDNTPLFNIMFALQNTPDLAKIDLQGVEVEEIPLENRTAVFDFVFDLKEINEELKLEFRYCADLFKEDTVNRFISHYEKLLASIIENREQSIGMLDIIPAAEQKVLVEQFSKAENYPAAMGSTVIGLFEEHVEKYAENPALSFGDQTLTYRELNERANKLSAYLIDQGVSKEMPVAIALERSTDLIIGIIAILKSGAAYVPIDVKLPAGRVHFLLDDIQAKIIITDESFKSKLKGYNGDITIVDQSEQKDEISVCDSKNPGVNSDAEHLANIIYTSGTTGRPKGVMVSNHNIVSLVRDQSYARLSDNDVLLSTGAPSFDASTFEYWGMLLNGGHLIMASENNLLVIELLKKEIQRFGVNKMWFTASWFNYIVDTQIDVLEGLDLVMAGGERLSEEHIYKVQSTYPQLSIVNGYGPTENTTFSLTYEIPADYQQENIPIGRPLSGRAAYVLDSNLNLVPVGVIGELYVGGSGVSMGYLNKPELTKERFMANEFEGGTSQLYKTGDLVRWRADGNLQYIGRYDSQVKIRGHRIELGEIENTLNLLDEVSNSCVVTVEGTGGAHRILSYIVPEKKEVQLLENQLQQSQVESWKNLYDSEYGKTENDSAVDEEFNIIGWNDSFTGEPIPAHQMREWLDDISEVIFHEQPQNVMEIGSGTGLIFYALAGKVNNYIGTDFSGSSVRQIQNRIDKGLREYGNNEFHVCPAHEVGEVPVNNVDTVILNSIIQYFPTESYLTEVIEKSIEKLNGQGRLIIGDIRDNRLLKPFKGRLTLGNYQGGMDKREYCWFLDQAVWNEEELCISPQYFAGLKDRFPEIRFIEAFWKRGEEVNELNLYRYTVIIHLQEKEEIKPTWQNWSEWSQNGDLEWVLQQPMFAIKDVPNPRLTKERLLLEAIDSDEIHTVIDIQQYLEQFLSEEERLVADLLRTARSKGHHYKLLLNEDPLKIDLLLSVHPIEGYVDNGLMSSGANQKKDLWSSPLFANINLELQKKVKELLQGQLPEYMVPAEIITIKEIPLTRHGKSDKQFLSTIKTGDELSPTQYCAPENKLQQDLVTIWKELLVKSHIGINDNFFELGGHSLLASRVVSTISSTLNINIKVRDLFMYPTIAELSAHIKDHLSDNDLPAISVERDKDFVPLSFAQERLHFIDNLQGSVQYNMPWVFNIKGSLNIGLLESAFRQIIERHSVLRTVFREEEEVGQHFLNSEDWTISTSEISGEQTREEYEEFINKQVNVPFDLAHDFMVRADIMKRGAEDHTLVVVFHHIAFDGWSIGIFVDELVKIYDSGYSGQPVDLPNLPIQYADYSIWQNRYFKGEYLDDLLGYWKEQLHGLKPIYLPTDMPRPTVQSTRGDTQYFYLDKELSEQLKRVSLEQGATLFMTMLSVFKVMMHKYTRETDLAIGVAIANRTRKEVEPLIGFFVNAIVIRTQLEKTLTFRDYMERVKDSTLKAYEYQDAPFEKVIETVVGKRKSVGNPLIQTMFVLQNTPDVPDLKLADLSLTSEVAANVTSKFDITYDLRDKPEGIEFRVEYCSDLFYPDTIKRMFDHYKTLLTSVVADIDKPIKSMKMMGAQEAHQMLTGFNR